MANTGKISVELKLLLDNLRKQAKEAAKTVQTEFAKAGAAGNVSASTSKAVTEQTKLTSSIKETTKALTAAQQARKKMLDEWRKSLPEPKIIFGGTGQSDVAITPSTPGAGDKPWENPVGNGGRLATPTSMPRPAVDPNLPKSLAMALRQVNPSKPALPSTPFPTLPNAPTPQPSSWKTMLPALAAGVGTALGGPLGGAVAGLLTKANPAVAAVTAVMTALRMAVSETAEAFKRAHDTYIRSMTSGFGLKMQATRQLLSQVIGVSENDIFQFGAAIAQFNEKLDVARKTIIETTPALAYTTMNWNVMMENISAAWMQFAAAVAPAINRIEDFVSSIMKLYILSGIPAMLGTLVSNFLETITRIVAALNVPAAGFDLLFITIKDGIKNAIQVIENAFLSMLNELTDSDYTMGELPGFDDTKKAKDAFEELIKVILGSSDPKKEKSQPVASMKQMPASSWERMGLVIGGSGGVNYNQQIAANTKYSNTLIEKLISASKFTIAQPAGMPATP